tara:strand:+ start:42337 stop:43629 length:1293 start_codon:yes stop_codon:yes gene_type:complete
MAIGMAGIVAYVSVGGLLKVFSGAGTLGLLFFSAIEIAKIVATSAIHTYSDKISWIYKGALSLGIGIAMVITSVGIYGFLSSTYKETFMKLENVEAQVFLLEKKRDGIQTQLNNIITEKTSIDGRISSLSSGLSNNVIQYKDPETGQIITTTSSSTRRALEKQLNGAMTRQDVINLKYDNLNDKVFELDNQIVEVKLGNDSAAELGPLKYLSEVTGKSMDEVMKYFIFLLIIIGDPMAVLMVIVFNKIVNKDEYEGEKKNKPDNKSKTRIKTIGSLFKNIKIPKIPTLIKKSNKTTSSLDNQIEAQVIDEVIPVMATESPSGEGLSSYKDIIEEPKQEGVDFWGNIKSMYKETPKSVASLTNITERLKEVIGKSKDIIEEPKETPKPNQGSRGFSIHVPDRKKTNAVNRIGTNKEVRDGDDSTIYFKKRG